jgi:hypothetical protein
MRLIAVYAADYRPFVMGRHLPWEGVTRKTFTLFCLEVSPRKAGISAEARHFMAGYSQGERRIADLDCRLCDFLYGRQDQSEIINPQSEISLRGPS